MSDGTKIEWTDATWNPITGCSVVSPGCTNCYAMKLAGTRLQHHPSRAGLTRQTKAGPVWTGEVRTNWDWMDQPLRWTKPRMIFVCAHGDLFHPDVPEDDIAMVYGVMIAAHHLRRHTFQILTKRPERALDLLTSEIFWDMAMSVASAEVLDRTDPLVRRSKDARATCKDYGPGKPPPGIWLGVSAEDQERADQRVPVLLATPAAIHFVSAEPLLGPIDFSRYLWPIHGWWRGPNASYNEAKAAGAECGLKRQALVGAWCRFLDWIIVGGENGPRPMQAEWAQQIRDQCAAAGAAFFFKQWGSHIPAGQTMANGKVWSPGCGTRLRATKAITGRLLDGIEHNAMPRAA